MIWKMHMFAATVVLLLCAVDTNRVLCLNITKTEITIVDNANRYFGLHPNATYTPFDKHSNAKGNIIFTSGERIMGDKLIMTFNDERQFAHLTDIEVSLWYKDDFVISCVEFYTDLTSTDSDVFYVNGGGIDNNFAEWLVVANYTYNFGYQLYLYGY